MKKLVLLLAIILVSCAVPPSIRLPTSIGIPSDFSGINYFVVDGMPCMYVDTGVNEGGISCDWSKWDGHVEDGEIVLP